MKAGCNIFKGLTLIDKATLLYASFTFLFIVFFSWKLDNIFPHLAFRMGVFIVVFLLARLSEKYPSELMKLFRGFLPIWLLSYWYGETAYMNTVIFDKFDPLISQLDERIFGFQPSMMFSAAFPQAWFSEVIHFGYFSYYFLTVFTCLLIYLFNRKYFEYTVFIVSASFFIYYLIFIFFPVVGPQYYFPADSVGVPSGYLFDKGVKMAQQMGEAPTGAFPSSHVGMSIIFLILLFKYYRKAFFITIPLTIILCFATVYIKAHYFVDVIAGLISAPLIFLISDKLFRMQKKNE